MGATSRAKVGASAAVGAGDAVKAMPVRPASPSSATNLIRFPQHGASACGPDVDGRLKPAVT